MTGRARRVAAVLREQHAHVHLVAPGLEPLEEPVDAVPDPLFPGALALQDPPLLVGGELGPRRVDGNAALARVPQQVVLAFAVALGLPGLDRTAAQGLAAVRDDQAVVDADHAAEAAAGFAGTQRRVEREQARRRLAIVDVAVGAVQVGRKTPDGIDSLSRFSGRGLGEGWGEGDSLSCFSGRLDADVDPPATDPQCGLERVDHARSFRSAEPEAVLHHLQLALAARVDARVALLLEQLEDLRFGEIVGHADRKRHDQARIGERGGPLASLRHIPSRACRAAPARRNHGSAAALRGRTAA